MKSTKSFTNLLLLGIICVAIVSCDIFEVESRNYDGTATAAFKFQNATVNASETEFSMEVQLIRQTEGVLEEDLPIEYEIVDSTTTATSPEDYEILTPSPVTIEAGALSTSLDLAINGSEIPAGESRTLVLQLTGNESEEVKGAEIVGKFELTIAGGQ